jgi:hypothetical protein
MPNDYTVYIHTPHGIVEIISRNKIGKKLFLFIFVIKNIKTPFRVQHAMKKTIYPAILIGLVRIAAEQHAGLVMLHAVNAAFYKITKKDIHDLFMEIGASP